MEQLYEAAFVGCTNDALMASARVLPAAAERLDARREGDVD